jgi:hypothetical protein
VALIDEVKWCLKELDKKHDVMPNISIGLVKIHFRYLDNHLKGTSQSQKRMRFVIGG